MVNSAPRPYQPFPDLVEHRTEDQKRADRERIRRQVADLERTGQDPEALTRLLMERRREAAGAGVVQVEVIAESTDEPAIAVPRELLLRLDRGSLDDGSSEAARALADLGFVSQANVLPDQEVPELDRRIARFVAPAGVDGEDDVVDRGLAELASRDFRSGRRLGMALHPVIKSATGPARSSMPEDYTYSRPHDEGERVVVAVIDTGIDEHERSDGWLAEMDRDPVRIDPLDVFPFGDGPPPANEFLDFAAGHGTFAAGLVRMVDAQAEIKAYVALDSDGLASETEIAKAMIAAVQEGAQVVNLSLGMRSPEGQEPLAFREAFDAIDASFAGREDERPVFVVSAGNYGDLSLVWPAAAAEFRDNVVSVAGLRADLTPADWSSRGAWVTCSTIGEGVVSTFVAGTEDEKFREAGQTGDTYVNPAWAVWTGTSFAAPQVAGAISRLCRDPDNPRTPLEAKDALLNEPGTETDPAYGKLLQLLPGTAPRAE